MGHGTLVYGLVGDPGNNNFANFRLSLLGDSRVRRVERGDDGIVAITVEIRSVEVEPSDVTAIEQLAVDAARNRVDINRRADLDSFQPWRPAEPQDGATIRRFIAPGMTAAVLREIQMLMEEERCQADMDPSDPGVLRLHMRHMKEARVQSIVEMILYTASLRGITLTPLDQAV